MVVVTPPNALIAVARDLYQRIALAEGDALAAAVELGNVLIRLKKSVPYGEFMDAVRDVGVNIGTAGLYMRIARLPPDELADCGTVRAADKASRGRKHRRQLADPPKSERREPPALVAGAALASPKDLSETILDMIRASANPGDVARRLMPELEQIVRGKV